MAGGPFGSDLVSRDYVESGVPVVRGVNLPLTSRFSCDNFVYVSPAKADRLHLNCAKPGDLVFTQRGTLGQVGVLPQGMAYEKFLISQSQMKMTVDETKACPAFIYYYFRSRGAVSYIESIALQAGVPHINLGILRKFPIVAPPAVVQRKVAAVLSAYDDLIENNRQRIALLERMAEQLYREWFVRFRFPGYQQAKFNKGLPADWDIGKLGKVIELGYGKALKEQDRVPGSFPVYGSSGQIGTHRTSLVDGPGIIVGRKGNVGAVHWCDGGFFPIDTAYFVKSDVSKFYLFFLLQTMNFLNNDAAVPGLNRQQAYANDVLIPSGQLIKQFEKLVKPIFEQRSILSRANDRLSITRDLLLPRLISGKLRVDDLAIQFPPSMQTERA